MNQLKYYDNIIWIHWNVHITLFLGRKADESSSQEVETQTVKQKTLEKRWSNVYH